jgi:hypothetical protein
VRMGCVDDGAALARPGERDGGHTRCGLRGGGLFATARHAQG